MLLLPTLYALLPIAPTSYILAFDLAPYSPTSMLLFLTPLLPLLQLRIPLHPMFLLHCFKSLCPAPFAPTPYALAFDPAPSAPNSVLLFLMLLLPMCTASYPLASYVPASNDSTLYALLPILLLCTSLHLIPLPILLIQCSCSLYICSLWASASYTLASYVLASYVAIETSVLSHFL
jgi:hypothetical protein